MKRVISIALIIGCMFLTGCGEHEKPPRVYAYSNRGILDIDVKIVGAAEFAGCNTIETDTGIDVVLHYKKKGD